MRLILLLILAVIAVAGCTQSTNDMYACKNGSLTQTPCNDFIANCAPIWNCTNWTNCSTSGEQIRNCTDSKKCGNLTGMPKESQSCAPTVPGSVYTEADADLAVRTGKALQDAASWDDFNSNYSFFGGSDAYMIKTPYFLAVDYVRLQVRNDGVISYAAVRDLLGANILSVVIQSLTNEYYVNSTRNMSVQIIDLNRTYKAASVRAMSEKSASLYGTNYKTTINATNIPGFEEYAKKTVYLVIVTNKTQTKYTVDMGRFK